MAIVDIAKTDETKPTVTGTVQSIFYESPDNFFKILLVKVAHKTIDWHETEIVVTGSFGDIKEDEQYTFYGKVVTHPKYGKQFQADNYQVDQPTTKAGLVAYLSGEKFTGIGQKTAEKIVDTLGIDAIDKILEDPTALEPLGLNAKKQAQLVETLTINNGMEQIIIGLNNYGFGSSMAYNIYQTYHEDTLKIIQENPYQLVADIAGIGFKRADNLAETLGFAADSAMRVQGALMQALNELTNQAGDTYTQAKPLLAASIELMEKARNVTIDPNLVAEQLMALAHDGKVVGDENRIYPNGLFNAEWQIANHLMRIENERDQLSYPKHDLDQEIRHLEKRFKMTYDDVQQEAIKLAMTHRAFLLTGGPGTGKTTIINGIVTLYAELNGLSLDINEYKDTPFPILLAAPTGRAAKRMSETTGLPASTIHRLLGITGRENNPDVSGNKELEGGLLIIDEMSMVDTYLFRSLLRAVPSHMQVVLVGDKDQLPSVGAGQVFFDLLQSKVIPAVELQRIYRQDDQSTIIPLAHEINQGQLPADLLKPQKDRSFIQCNPYQIESVIEQVVTKAKARGFETKDIQVLAPMYKGAAGIDQLNPMIQNIMNPKLDDRKKQVSIGNVHYRIGDKVLHLVNSPEQNVFNGEIGQITGITYAKKSADKVDEITIAFDSAEVTYKRSEWHKITLAYCTSIHKAQGSEFEMVILPLVNQYQRMLKRNLLYTAVTRAKSLLILIGEPSAFQKAAQELSANRQTTLKERIQSVFNGEQLSTAIKTASVGQTEAKTIVDQPAPPSAPETAVDEQLNLVPEDDDAIQETPISYVLTPTVLTQQQVDPMIGMTGVTPYDFMPKSK
ncbi:ATP-dependent RecD-like DNA helicase [Latilactobacillus curvatus]|uniref:SF1B family DNA helicase RecD2 n=1 Tax=Latilactobacillus curvatus TaxID=28038 RepID=UPI000F7CF5EF|nr:ATP-dependent RecD-like DNA helicase [Latilactobacillus curvatus]AZP96249.1 ATP-dependent RecD-like DNA helicase [Latilactobacillus curvatus]